MKRTELRRYTPLTASKRIERQKVLQSRSRLRPMSAKRRAENVVRRRMLAELGAVRGPTCEVPWCRRRWVDGHEPMTRGRGGSIVDPSNCKLVCRRHNEELTMEPAWGYEIGFLRHSWEH
jgi:hypothetical protein